MVHHGLTTTATITQAKIPSWWHQQTMMVALHIDRLWGKTKMPVIIKTVD